MSPMSLCIWPCCIQKAYLLILWWLHKIKILSRACCLSVHCSLFWFSIFWVYFNNKLLVMTDLIQTFLECLLLLVPQEGKSIFCLWLQSSEYSSFSSPLLLSWNLLWFHRQQGAERVYGLFWKTGNRNQEVALQLLLAQQWKRCECRKIPCLHDEHKSSWIASGLPCCFTYQHTDNAGGGGLSVCRKTCVIDMTCSPAQMHVKQWQLCGLCWASANTVQDQDWLTASTASYWRLC